MHSPAIRVRDEERGGACSWNRQEHTMRSTGRVVLGVAGTHQRYDDLMIGVGSGISEVVLTAMMTEVYRGCFVPPCNSRYVILVCVDPTVIIPFILLHIVQVRVDPSNSWPPFLSSSVSTPARFRFGGTG